MSEGQLYDTGLAKWRHGEITEYVNGRTPSRWLLGPCPRCGSVTHTYGSAYSCTNSYCLNSASQFAVRPDLTPTWWNTGVNVKLDGDAWFAHGPDFTNLQESETGWGATPRHAVEEFLKRTTGQPLPESSAEGEVEPAPVRGDKSPCDCGYGHIGHLSGCPGIQWDEEQFRKESEAASPAPAPDAGSPREWDVKLTKDGTSIWREADGLVNMGETIRVREVVSTPPAEGETPLTAAQELLSQFAKLCDQVMGRENCMDSFGAVTERVGQLLSIERANQGLASRLNTLHARFLRMESARRNVAEAWRDRGEVRVASQSDALADIFGRCAREVERVIQGEDPPSPGAEWPESLTPTAGGEVGGE